MDLLLLGVKKYIGGNSSAVGDQLKGVQQIQATTEVHLLRFWQMGMWLPGVLQTVVVTVRQFEMNSELFSQVVCADL